MANLWGVGLSRPVDYVFVIYTFNEKNTVYEMNLHCFEALMLLVLHFSWSVQRNWVTW